MNQRMINVLNYHIQRYPALEVQDIYKLLFQAANGPRHYMERYFNLKKFHLEWQKATSIMGQEPIEPVSADGLLVRCNFAGLRESNVSPNLVVNAALQTAVEFISQPANLISWWNDFRDLIASRLLNLDMEQYIKLNEEFLQWGFIVKSHSKPYRLAYSPAYLVVLRKHINI